MSYSLPWPRPACRTGLASCAETLCKRAFRAKTGCIENLVQKLCSRALCTSEFARAHLGRSLRREPVFREEFATREFVRERNCGGEAFTPPPHRVRFDERPPALPYPYRLSGRRLHLDQTLCARIRALPLARARVACAARNGARSRARTPASPASSWADAASRGVTGLPSDACGANGPQTRSRVRWPRGWRRPAS